MTWLMNSGLKIHLKARKNKHKFYSTISTIKNKYKLWKKAFKKRLKNYEGKKFFHLKIENTLFKKKRLKRSKKKEKSKSNLWP